MPKQERCFPGPLPWLILIDGIWVKVTFFPLTRIPVWMLHKQILKSYSAKPLTSWDLFVKTSITWTNKKYSKQGAEYKEYHRVGMCAGGVIAVRLWRCGGQVVGESEWRDDLEPQVPGMKFKLSVMEVSWDKAGHEENMPHLKLTKCLHFPLEIQAGRILYHR